jgi:hypothetical protein
MNRCIACGSETLRVVFTKGPFEIVRCATCGLGRTTLPEAFDPSTYYSRSYFDGGVADGYADYRATERTLRTEFRHTLDWILRTTPARGALLEFGCAYGFFLQEARPHFLSVHGVDVSADAAAFCRARGLDVRRRRRRRPVAARAVRCRRRPRRHRARARAARDAARARLADVTRRPDRDDHGDWAAVYPRIAGRHWRLMTPPQHLSFFTPQSIGRMLDAAGLRVLSMTHPWRRVPLSLAAYNCSDSRGCGRARDQRPRSAGVSD